MNKTLIIATSLIGFGWTLEAQRERPTPPDPEVVATEMIADYDTDQNNALNNEELAAALKGIREKHREQMGDRPRRGPEAGGPGPDGERPRKKEGQQGKKDRPGPEQRVSRMIENFDKDSDSALNSEELVAALKWMHENRGNRKGGPGPRGPQGPVDAES